MLTDEWSGLDREARALSPGITTFKYLFIFFYINNFYLLQFFNTYFLLWYILINPFILAEDDKIVVYS